MKKEKQIGIRVGVPAFFALELEDVYRHTDGAHRALAFPDFVGLLVGMGLEAYRAGSGRPAPEGDDEEEGRAADSMGLFDIDRDGLQDMFSDFDEAMEPREGPRLRLVHTEGTA